MRVHTSIAEIPEATWDGLEGVREAPFLSHAFLRALETTGCVGRHAGWLPHILSFWQAGRLVAAAPAYVKSNSEGEFVFDQGWAAAAENARIPYYPKLVVAAPFTPATSNRLLVVDPKGRAQLLPVFAEALKQLTEDQGLSSAHVLFPSEDEANALAQNGLSHRVGIQFQFFNDGYTTFDDFLERFSSKRRNQIRREMREMTKQGIVITTERGPFPPAILDAMYDFYVVTVEKFPWGRQYLNRSFFEEISTALGERLEFVIAREGSRIIAGALNYAGPRVLYGRYWGAREERPFLHFNVCYYHTIEGCIRRKLVRFEPGAGGEYKLVRGFRPTITHSAHHIEHAGLRRAVRQFVDQERAEIERAVASEDAAFG